MVSLDDYSTSGRELTRSANKVRGGRPDSERANRENSQGSEGVAEHHDGGVAYAKYRVQTVIRALQMNEK